MRAVGDTASEAVRDLFAGQSYSSLVTLPVALRCMPGKRLAIVSLDASVPGVFTETILQQGFEQAVSPYVKLIALSLSLRDCTP